MVVIVVLFGCFGGIFKRALVLRRRAVPKRAISYVQIMANVGIVGIWIWISKEIQTHSTPFFLKSVSFRRKHTFLRHLISKL